MKLNLTCEVIEKGPGRIKFRLLTNFNPTLELIREIQEQMGFRPSTFGGPWQIKVGLAKEAQAQAAPMILLSTWYCSKVEAPL